MSLSVRPANREDLRRFWEWANDPDTRKASFSETEIPWDDHVSWFESRLSNPDSVLCVVTAPSEEPVAHVRFDRRDATTWEVSVTVGPPYRGQGYGPKVIKSACRWFLDREASAKVIRALIKPWNEASVRSFARCGFVQHPSVTRAGSQVLVYCLERSELS